MRLHAISVEMRRAIGATVEVEVPDRCRASLRSEYRRSRMGDPSVGLRPRPSWEARTFVLANGLVAAHGMTREAVAS